MIKRKSERKLGARIELLEKIIKPIIEKKEG